MVNGYVQEQHYVHESVIQWIIQIIMLFNNMSQERFQFSTGIYNIAISRQHQCSAPKEKVFSSSDPVDQKGALPC